MLNYRGDIMKKIIGDFGVQWTEFDKNDRMKRKKKIFKTEKQRDKFVEKLEQKDNFLRFDAWSNEGYVSKGEIKNEIKALYKKDPILAKKVAKVLGYKVHIADTKSDYTKLKNVFMR